MDLTNYKDQYRSWEANCPLGSQEVLSLLWNLKVDYRAH